MKNEHEEKNKVEHEEIKSVESVDKPVEKPSADAAIQADTVDPTPRPPQKPM